MVQARAGDEKPARLIGGDFHDPCLLRPVDMRGGGDLPPGAAVTRAAAAENPVDVVVAVDPGDHVAGLRDQPADLVRADALLAVRAPPVGETVEGMVTEQQASRCPLAPGVRELLRKPGELRL